MASIPIEAKGKVKLMVSNDPQKCIFKIVGDGEKLNKVVLPAGEHIKEQLEISEVNQWDVIVRRSSDEKKHETNAGVPCYHVDYIYVDFPIGKNGKFTKGNQGKVTRLYPSMSGVVYFHHTGDIQPYDYTESDYNFVTIGDDNYKGMIDLLIESAINGTDIVVERYVDSSNKHRKGTSPNGKEYFHHCVSKIAAPKNSLENK